jgi:hypothetical protein
MHLQKKLPEQVILIGRKKNLTQHRLVWLKKKGVCGKDSQCQCCIIPVQRRASQTQTAPCSTMQSRASRAVQHFTAPLPFASQNVFYYHL